MLVVVRRKPHYDWGANATVFFTPDGRATKVFRQRHDVTREHVERVFNSEKRAYERVLNDQELLPIVPRFYGTVQVDKVLGENGEDLSDEFFLDLAYQMDFVSGDFIKLGQTDDRIRERVISAFMRAGVPHIEDASVVLINGEVSCVIDFAMQHYPLEHPDL